MDATSIGTHQLMLQESIELFISQYRNGVTDFSNFASIFSRLLHGLFDPPIKIVWFYSALTFHSAKFTVREASEKVSVAKDLFQYIVSCSASCNVVKKIAMLAPVVYELYQLATCEHDLKGEFENLVEGVVSYVSICCGGKIAEEDDASLALDLSFMDLIRVWMVDKFEEDLGEFFPVVSDEILKGIRSLLNLGVLAGIVMSEAFLLRLCLMFGSGSSRAELQRDMYDWAVQTIIGFHSLDFFDILLRMLLEPVLPLMSMLNLEEERLLREILYDAVIMVNYMFLKPQRQIQVPSHHLKDLSMKWLFVAESAIWYGSQKGDQIKIVSYLNGFSKSCLISYLINWVMNLPGMCDKLSGPNVSTPVALIKWILKAEDQGIEVFNDDIYKLQAKAIICKPIMKDMFRNSEPDDDQQPDYKILFSSDQEDRDEGDVDMVDSIDKAFFTAPIAINSTTTEITGKRKEWRTDEGETWVKYVKCRLHENSAMEDVLQMCRHDGLSSGNEMANPILDNYVENMEQ